MPNSNAAATASDVADDDRLVRASQAGDRDAFGLLVARHAGAILGLARRMVGPGMDADDVAQDTFVAAFRALPGFQGGAKFATWLYRIAINKCHDRLRARQHAEHVRYVKADDAGWDPAAGDAATPLDALVDGEIASELDAAIQSLPPLYREAFLLRHVEDLGYDEMADVLGVHRHTLKMRVYRARAMLCRQLAHLEGVRR